MNPVYECPHCESSALPAEWYKTYDFATREVFWRCFWPMPPRFVRDEVREAFATDPETIFVCPDCQETVS